MTHLLLTVRFLDDRYHGLLGRDDLPEWPPSPFRLFQALVAGVARRGELVNGSDTLDNTDFTDTGKAIGWLQKRSAPIIVTPKSQTGQAITRFVPNNDGDKKFDRQKRLTAKRSIPTLLLLEPGQKPEIHYVWDISDCADAPIDRLRDAARSLTALGWGIDMAFADADRADDARLQAIKGVRWYPKKGAARDDGMLRTPTYDDESKECTLCDLRHCHQTAMNRIEHGQPLKTVDKPKVFDRVLYCSSERPIGRPFAVFKMVDANEDAIRYPHAKLIHIAGMTRHAAIKRMLADPPSVDNSDDWVCRVVRGKRDESFSDEHRQFSYVPLPSIGHEHADAMIRNVMLVAPLGMDRELKYLAERLNGELLTPDDRTEACTADSPSLVAGSIELQWFKPPPSHFINRCYLGTSSVWHTVTPIILDGHNRRSKSDKPQAVARETEKLVCKALARAGIETPCEFTWQSVPFVKNCLSAHKYDRDGRPTGYFRPSHLSGNTLVHLRIRFGRPEIAGDSESTWLPVKVKGPIAIGAGRHCGFGLLAAVDTD